MVGTLMRGRGRKLVAAGLAATLLAQTACGTLLYPDRRGQDRGQIDPAVAIMNGIGLLFFVIPGLVAFAIDFSTGAIYLPPDEADGADVSQADMQRIGSVDPEELDAEALSQVLSEHVGEPVEVTEQQFQQIKRGEATLDAEGRVVLVSE